MLGRRRRARTSVLLFSNVSQKPFTNNLLPAVRGFEAVARVRLVEPIRYRSFIPTGGSRPAPIPEDAIADGLRRFDPDVVVCLGGGLTFPAGIWDASPFKGVTVGIALSDPLGLAASLEIAPRFDLFYTQDPQTVPVYREHGVDVRRCDLAIDPSLIPPANHAPDCDVLYFGKWTHYRDEVVATLARRFDVRVHAYANERRWSVPAMPPLEDPEELGAALAKSRLALELARLDDAPEPYRDTYRITYRPYFAAACGIPTLIERFDRLGEFFEPGEEIAAFDGLPDLIDRTEWLLRDGAARQRMGELARARVLRQHTWEQRAEAILADASEVRG